MSGSKSGTGSRWWVMLVLVACVVAAAVLYMSPVGDRGAGDGERQRVTPIAETAPSGDAATGGEAAGADQPPPPTAATAEPDPIEPVAGEPAETPEVAREALGSPEVDQPAEQQSLPAGSDPSASPPVAAAAPAVAPALSTSDPPQDSRGMPAPAVPAIDASGASQKRAAGDAPASVTPQEAEAFAKAVISEDGGAQSAGADLSAAPAATIEPPAARAAAMPAVPAPPAPVSVPAVESIEERRARIMAEYQSMQRQYQEQMRAYRESRGVPRMPWMRPYGPYPGYAPGPERPRP